MFHFVSVVPACASDHEHACRTACTANQANTVDPFRPGDRVRYLGDGSCGIVRRVDDDSFEVRFQSRHRGRKGQVVPFPAGAGTRFQLCD